MSAEARRETPLASLHDAELAHLASAGGRDAFGELARRHGSAVRTLLRRMGAEPALADDIAQDAFLAAFERVAEFRGEGAFVGWIKRIAARLLLKRWRKRAWPDFRETSLETEAEPSHGESQAVQSLDLDAALQTLSAAERLCVSLCYGGGFSHAEVSATLNLPLGTVKSHVKRGLDKLKQRLVEEAASSDTAGRRTVG